MSSLLSPLSLSGTYVDYVKWYLTEHQWNDDMLRKYLHDDDYEVVWPFQLRDKVRIGIDTVNYMYTNRTVHHEEVTMVIRNSATGRLKLNLKRNDVLMPEGAQYRQMIKTNVFNDMADTPPNCFYQGRVLNGNAEATTVALSTCEGLRGVIFTHNATYVIVPLKGGDLGKRHAHVLFRARLADNLHCANANDLDFAPQHRGRRSTSRGNSETGEKYVELAVVADYGLAREWEFRFAPMLNYVLESVNVVDAIWQHQLNTRVALTYVQAWTEKAVVSIESDITQTLLNVVDYTSEHMGDVSADVTVLMTWNTFDRREVSMSTQSQMCNARAAGVMTCGPKYDPMHTSAMLSHNIAHTLGIRHDDASCTCDSGRDCVMDKRLGGKEMSPVFSRCSVTQYERAVQEDRFPCLFNAPLQQSSLGACGNGVLDEGEMCDCGTVAECAMRDPCCDAVTCQLKSDAQCATGPCCHNCRPLPSSTECRASAGSCDVPETCDGSSGMCPNDAHKVDASVCEVGGIVSSTIGGGVCHHGRCTSRDGQCQAIWGHRAKSASTQCYTHFNVMGVSHGHCGSDLQGRLTSCRTVDDSQCGLLHCEGGHGQPIAARLLYTNTELAAGRDSRHQCKTVTSLPAGLVNDGTPCGDGKTCSAGRCDDRPPAVITCPSNNAALVCSGHGTCTTVEECYCDGGFSGDDCSVRVPGWTPTIGGRSGVQGRMDIGGQSVETATMLIIVGGVAAGLFLLMIFLLVCYRRRSSTVHKPHGKHSTDKDSVISVETATQRSIKFGDMPSYRNDKRAEEKRARKKHSQTVRPADDLSRIDERSNEQDTVSNKSAATGVNSQRSRTPDTPKLPPPCPPDRGILKRHGTGIYGERQLLVTSHGDAGYESEPVVAQSGNMFEAHMRQIEIYARAAPSPTRSDYYEHHHQMLSLAQPTADTSMNGYSTDTGANYGEHRRLTSLSAASTPRYIRRRLDDSSPTTSVVSQSSRLKQPQPIQLRNIQLLMEQLDKQEDDEVALNSTIDSNDARQQALLSSLLDPHARTSQQSSDGACEQSSHTESHRDALDMPDCQHQPLLTSSPLQQLQPLPELCSFGTDHTTTPERPNLLPIFHHQ